MKEFSSTVSIRFTLDEDWTLLADAASHASRDPQIKRIERRIAPG
jgi:hypothetical protein